MSDRGDQGSGEASRDLTRRRMIGLGAAAVAAGGVLALGAARDRRRSRAGGRRVEVLAACLGCTGCVTVCPEAALSVGPGCRPVVQEDRCTRCGYCVAVCPVDALRVTREAGHA